MDVIDERLEVVEGEHAYNGDDWSPVYITLMHTLYRGQEKECSIVHRIRSRPDKIERIKVGLVRYNTQEYYIWQ